MVDSTTSTMVTTSTTTYVSGLSGFDSSALIEAAVQAELQPAYRLEAEITEDQATLASYGELQDYVEAMEDPLNSLRNEPGTFGEPSVFETRQAYLSVDDGSTASNFLGVSVAENTEPASYGVEIQQLATAHKIGSDPVTNQDTALGMDGTVNIGAGEKNTDVTITADMDLEDIRDAFNDLSDESGVTASILKVSDDEYMLVFSASETGHDIEMSPVSGDDLSQNLGFFAGDGSVSNELQTAQNAIVIIDGVQIERSSNTIDDAIEGVTLDLYGANEGGTFTVEVGHAYADVKDTLVAFVDAYNEYRDFALTHQDVDSSGNVGEEATLFGDDVLRGVNDTLYDALTATTEVDGEMYSWASMGITFDDDNKLVIDDAVMDEFLLNNIDIAAQMFEFQYSSDSENLQVLSHEGNIPGGDYELDIQVDGDGNITSVSSDGDDSLFDIDGTTISGKSGTEFEGMIFVFTGTESETVNLSISQGFADQLYNSFDAYTNVVDGLLTEAMRSLETDISSNQEEIAEIEDAAMDEQDRLISYYANLEAQIAQTNAIADYLDAINNANNS